MGGRLDRRRGAVLAAMFAALLLAPAQASAGCGILGLQACPAYPTAPDPGGTETPDQPVPATGKLFGFNSSLSVNRGVPAGQEMDFATGAGANVHRLAIGWRFLQKSPGDPPLPPHEPGNFVDRIDQWYAAALARGVTPLLIPYWAPAWASRYRDCGILDLACKNMRDSEEKLVPDIPFLDEYEVFVRAVKQRWPQAVIEPWNEPNLHWGNRYYRNTSAYYAEPEHYAQIQCAAYRASKSVNDLPVLAAGWAKANFVPYVDRVLAAGGHDCWDRANLHTYPGTQTDFGANSLLAFDFKDLRTLRERYGDEDPIWVTETGYTNSGDLVPVSEAAQADGSRRLYNRMITMPDVEAVIFHTLRDAPTHDLHPSQHEYGFGFLREDWAPKPVYCHFAKAAGRTATGC